MDVNAVSTTTNTAASTATYANNTQTTTAAETESKTTNDAGAAAVYEQSTEKTKYTPDRNKITEMINESERQVESFRKLIEGVFKKQGEKFTQAYSSLKDFYANLEVDEATRAKAAEDISEDGYYGVKQTSERILEFAKALSGGDPSKISMLRDAVEKGFGAAASAWGSELPDISKQTYEAVMKGFDEWEKEANASTQATASTPAV